MARVARNQDLLESHGVMLALSEARAAHWVFDELHAGNLDALLGASDTRGWLHRWAADALGRSLDQAEAAFRKAMTAETAKPPAAVALMATRKDPRARAKPGEAMDLNDLAFAAEKLEAVVHALDGATLECWSPFMTYPGDLSEEQASESLKLALFDQALALSSELRQGLNRLLGGETR
jgi:hypothetical protein